MNAQNAQNRASRNIVVVVSSSSSSSSEAERTSILYRPSHVHICIGCFASPRQLPLSHCPHELERGKKINHRCGCFQKWPAPRSLYPESRLTLLTSLYLATNEPLCLACLSPALPCPALPCLSSPGARLAIDVVSNRPGLISLARSYTAHSSSSTRHASCLVLGSILSLFFLTPTMCACVPVFWFWLWVSLISTLDGAESFFIHEAVSFTQ